MNLGVFSYSRITKIVISLRSIPKIFSYDEFCIQNEVNFQKIQELRWFKEVRVRSVMGGTVVICETKTFLYHFSQISLYSLKQLQKWKQSLMNSHYPCKSKAFQQEVVWHTFPINIKCLQFRMVYGFQDLFVLFLDFSFFLELG